MSGLLRALLAVLAKRGRLAGGGGASIAVAVDSGVFDDFEAVVWGAVRDEVEQRAGVVLFVDDDSVMGPFSDASLSAGLSERFGFALRSVYDTDVMREDVTTHVSALVSEKTKIPLTNVTDYQALQTDLQAHVAGKISEHTGMALTDLSSREAVDRDVRAYIESKMAELVVDKIAEAADKLMLDDVGLDELMGLVRHAQDLKGVRVRDVAIGTAAAALLAGYAVMDRKIARDVRRLKRREQNRMAQRDFRARHGSRMRYQPLEDVQGG